MVFWFLINQQLIVSFKYTLIFSQDIKFVARCAMNAVSSDFELMKNVLNYAENLVKSHISSNVSKGQ